MKFSPTLNLSKCMPGAKRFLSVFKVSLKIFLVYVVEGLWTPVCVGGGILDSCVWGGGGLDLCV